MKRFILPLITALSLPTAINAEDKINNITSRHESNSLSQYGIIDYASAVSWCRKKISDNHYDYELQIERIYSHPADFCREHFIPSIQSKSRSICLECDLDPNLILANLVEAIKKPGNLYGSDIVLMEEVYSEENINNPSYIYESNERISDTTDKNKLTLTDKPDENNKTLSNKPDENKLTLTDKPDENNKTLSNKPDKNKLTLTDKPDENNKTLSNKPDKNNKTLSDKPKENTKSISNKNDEKSKGIYFTSSIGLSKISDIKIQDTNSDIEFDTGLGFDIGIGYDFGKNRLEASWARGQSDEVSLLGYSIESDSRIDSLLFSYYYDFRDHKKWSPFIGASIGSTNVDINGVEETGLTYGFGYGLSYKTSEIVDFFIKGQTMVVPELDFGTISIENGNYTNGTVGIRYRF